MHINGHTLYVECHGPENGPPVVLLHHGLGSTRAWKKQIPALVHAGWRVIVYDRWGYGKSQARDGIDMPVFEQDQADLLALLDALELSKVTLVGHSDGGTISLYTASRFPEKVALLVTVAAHIYFEPKMEPGIESIRAIWKQDEGFRRAFKSVHGEKFESVFNNWYCSWHRPECLDWDMRPILARIQCPAFVVQGMLDEHATPQHARDLAACIPGAQLWLAEGVTHMLPQDQPEPFNTRLLDFLSRSITLASR
jgi:pimeloyl-ACP methyl ester carboxylesterase